jgi:putative transposase
LVHDHDGIGIEDLNIQGLARTRLARSFRKAAMGEFRRQLEDKCLWNRKHRIPIDRFFPAGQAELGNAQGARVSPGPAGPWTSN